MSRLAAEVWARQRRGRSPRRRNSNQSSRHRAQNNLSVVTLGCATRFLADCTLAKLGLLGPVSKPEQQPSKHRVKLLPFEPASFPDGPCSRIGCDVLHEECARFQKRCFNLKAISCRHPRRLVVCGRIVISARSSSPYATLRTGADRTLAAMPKSNSQTSPRAGVILFGV